MRSARCSLRVITGLLTLVLAHALTPWSALAHDGGRAELLIVEASVATDPAGLALEVKVVDADSGEPQPGYTTTVVTRTAGTSSGAVHLTDLGAGRYGGTVDVASGGWDLLVRVDQGPGAPPANPTSVNLVVEVAPDGEVTLLQGPPAQSSVPVLELGATVAAVLLGGLALMRRRRKAVI